MALRDQFAKLRGILGTILRFGTGGLQLRTDAGGFECRDAANALMVVCRGLNAVSATDFTTRLQLEAIQQTIVWQPGGAAGQGTNVFVEASPANALAAFGLLFGDRTLILDGVATAGTVTFPALAISGGVNPGRATLAGRHQGVNGALQPVVFPIGSTLSRWDELRDMNITNNATASLYQIPADGRVDVRNCAMSSTAAGAFAMLAAAFAATVRLFDSSSVVAGGGNTFGTTAATGGLDVLLFDKSLVPAAVSVLFAASALIYDVCSEAATVGAQAAGVDIVVSASRIAASFSADSLSAPGLGGAASAIPPGWGALSLDVALPTSLQAQAGLVSKFAMRHLGDVGNAAGRTVSYELRRLSAAGATTLLDTIVLAADGAAAVHAEQTITPAVNLGAGDSLLVVATPSGVLAAALSAIAGGAR